MKSHNIPCPKFSPRLSLLVPHKDNRLLINRTELQRLTKNTTLECTDHKVMATVMATVGQLMGNIDQFTCLNESWIFALIFVNWFLFVWNSRHWQSIKLELKGIYKCIKVLQRQVSIGWTYHYCSQTFIVDYTLISFCRKHGCKYV